VEIARQACELLRQSFAAGEPVTGLLDCCTPDIRIDASHRVFNPAVYDGIAGVHASIAETYDSWQDFDPVTDRLIDLGDRVLAIQTISGRGRTTDLEVRGTGALILSVSGAQIERIEIYADVDEALRAVGLEE
jgi:hypothetical protein